MQDPNEVYQGRRGIFCAGGGYRGIFHAGFLEAIFRRGAFSVNGGYFGATSVGALILLKLSEAEKDEDLLPLLGEVKSTFLDFIDKLGPKAVFPFPEWWQLPVRVWNSDHILSGETLFRMVKNCNPEKAIRSPITFEFTVLDDRTKRRVTLSNKDEQFKRDPELLRRAIVASASLCPIFPAVEVGGNIYRDGGSIDLTGAVRHGCDSVFVLFPYPEEYYEPKPDDFFSRHFPLMVDFKSCYAAELRARDMEEVAKLRAHNELARLHNQVVAERRGHKAERVKDQKRITALQEKIASVEREFSLLNLAGDLAAKLKGGLASLKERLLGIDDKEQAGVDSPLMKVISEVVLFGDRLDTLTLTEFKPGVDFATAYELGIAKMERALEKLPK